MTKTEQQANIRCIYTRRQAPLGPIGLRRKTDFEYLKDQGKVRYAEMASC